MYLWNVQCTHALARTFVLLTFSKRNSIAVLLNEGLQGYSLGDFIFRET